MKFFKTSLATVIGFTLLGSNARAVELSFERDPSVPLVYINVAVKSGSASDPAGQSGVVNFMGEMLLRGTNSRNKEAIDRELDQMGARLAVETRSEATIVRGAVLSSQLEPFLALLKEIITQPSFPEHEMSKLKKEIISGILEELGRDQSLAARKFTRYLFQSHPYGKPVLGSVKDIERLSRAQVMAVYDRMIRDKQMVVIATGDTDEGVLKRWTQSIAAARSGGNASTLVARPEDSSKRRVQIVDKPDRTQTQIDGGQVGVRMTDDRFFPLYLANHAFGGGSFSARLMVEIRVKRGWSYGAYSYFRHGRQPRSWQFHLFPASKDTAAALKTTLQMVEEFRQKGITEQEFEFSKASLINSAGFMYNTPQKRMENKLLERTLDLPEGLMKSYAQHLAPVTLDQANSAVKEFFRPEQLAISVLATAKDLKPAIAEATGVKESEIQVVPYTQE